MVKVVRWKLGSLSKVGSNLYSLLTPEDGGIPEVLMQSAQRLAKFFVKHPHVITSYKYSNIAKGRPVLRSGSHARGVSLDVAPLWVEGDLGSNVAKEGRSARLGEFLPPLWALTTVVGREPVAYVAEGDHWHLQLLKQGPARVLIYPHPRPGVYEGDAVRSEWSKTVLLQVNPDYTITTFDRDLLL